MRKLGVLGNALLFAVIGVISASGQGSDDKWTGYYVGGFGGVTLARPGISATTVATPDGYFADSSVGAVNAEGTRTLKASGFTGRGQFG